MKDLCFEPVSLEKLDRYLERLSLTPEKASDYGLVNLWGWAEVYDLQWAWDDPLVWFRQNRPHPAFWAPVGPWNLTDWEKALLPFKGLDTFFTRIPEHLLDIWRHGFSGRIQEAAERGNWDYLYLAEELASLKGNRFHKKKNLVHQFEKNHPFEYVPLNLDRIAAVLSMQETWCTWRDCESSEALDAENRAISRVLDVYSQFKGLLGGGILCDGRMIAYTLGEALDDEVLLIHFEKGDAAYPGVYQAINRLFVAQHKDRFRFVNREQDLDNPGLRQAKLSYHPVDYVRKYRVTLSPA